MKQFWAVLLLLCCVLMPGGSANGDDDHQRGRKDYERAWRKLDHREREIARRYRNELEDADDWEDYREAREEYHEDLRDLENDRRKQLRKHGRYEPRYFSYESHYRYPPPVHLERHPTYDFGPQLDYYDAPRPGPTFHYQGKHLSIYVD